MEFAVRRGLMRAVAIAVLTCGLGAAAAESPPQFKVDPFWPQTLPNNWTLGEISGVAVDADDNVWVIHRPGTLTPRETKAARNPPASPCCVPAPPVLAFSKDGQVIAAWGGPGQDYDWPSNEHGITVDPKGHVWVMGNGNGLPGPDGKPDGKADGMALKFTRDGKFIMQIGGRGVTKGSRDTTIMAKPPKVVFDSEGKEAYFADGYTNRRVIVFDAETGAYKRMWGAYGNVPSDDAPASLNPKTKLPDQFALVHCVVRADDGMVYVCDRQHQRIQVFDSAGKFQKEFLYNTPTLDQSIPGRLADLAVWPDKAGTYLVIADGNFENIHIVRRDNGASVMTVGRQGRYAGEFSRLHVLAVDSRGNIFTGEAGGGRVQKFAVTAGTPAK